MNRAAGILAIGIGLLIGAGSVIPEAVAEGPQPGIVLAQAEQAEQQRPNVFRFLTRPFRRGVLSKIGLVVSAPVAPAEVTPERLQDQVLALRGDWK